VEAQWPVWQAVDVRAAMPGKRQWFACRGDAA
jgi:hypothetical protein